MSVDTRPEIPHGMNRFARNQRLFDQLFSMGLFVEAFLLDEDPQQD